MNGELEALILAYESACEARDTEAGRRMQVFEALLDKVQERQPHLSRDTLRQVIIREHRKWALKQERKPPAIPPRT